MLTHRYAFDSDANDGIAGANGVLVGNALINNNAVVLDGTNSSVVLPNDLFTNYDSVSFEAWFADVPVNSTNALIYNFRGPQGAMKYLLTGIGSYSLGTASNTVALPSPAVGGTNHLVWTQDSASKDARIYVNGHLARENTNFAYTPTTVGSTTNNQVGGGILPSSYFKGSILEFRTYQGALDALDVALLDAWGPDQLPSDPGQLSAVRLAVPSPTGPGAVFSPAVFADFANVSNVDISSLPDLALNSANTNVVSITADKRIRTLGLGTANITVTWQGQSNTVAMTVAVPRDVELLHRYSFNEQTNDWIVHDSVKSANGRVYFGSSILFPPPAPPPTGFTGNGDLRMVGYPASGSYAALPGGLISGLSEVSIEAWVTWTPGNVSLTYGNAAWQRIFDFGSQVTVPVFGVVGLSYLFLTPATDNVSFTTNSVLHTAITTDHNYNETPRLNWTSKLPTNVMSFVAVTYSPVRGVMKLYLNGIAVDAGAATIPLSAIVDTNCWLGRSLFQADAYFYGSYQEFRIYGGLLSDSDIKSDYNAGPEVVGVDYVLHAFAVSNALSLTWGPSASGMVLESSPALGAAAQWTRVHAERTFENGRFKSTLPLSPDAAFFRLRSQ